MCTSSLTHLANDVLVTEDLVARVSIFGPGRLRSRYSERDLHYST